MIAIIVMCVLTDNYVYEFFFAPAEYPLPGSWCKYLPEVDHQWISKALVKWSATGKPEIAYSQINKLWWHPP